MNEETRGNGRANIQLLKYRYAQARAQDPDRYDLLDMLTIEAMLKFVQNTRRTDARAIYLSKLETLIGDERPGLCDREF